jgi:TonB family protein
MHSGASLAGPASLDQRRLRLLWLALLGSLALHALILFLLPLIERSRAERSAPPPITAHLAKPAPLQPVPPHAEPPPPQPSPRQAARPPQLPPRRPAPSTAPVSQPESVLSTAPAKPVAEPAPVARPPVPPAPAAQAEAPPPAPSEASSAPDPGNLARYRLELLTMAQRYERYPRIARDNGWIGRVGLRIAISEAGALAPITVIKSSGRTVLDDEGRSMIRSAHPQVPLPPALRGKAFSFDVYINFTLEER